ncbi:prosalusin isoform X2 [Cynoglossus semilaevis]|uniref:prosalusin isoform X2 n=1 Tax=Cynoglossus semilaevis TaxID=244447 RepID=UPI000D626FDC|nr:prosalusin isoform X2 [Cynoglossus semilaevis]
MSILRGVLFLTLYSQVFGVFQKIYCSLSDSCECDFKPNLRDLEWDLYRNVYGQHLVQDIVSEEVAKFLQDKNPERPLVLSFHGSSGTGKTMVSSMLGTHLYGWAMSSPYVHQFVPTLHFPSRQLVHEYREELKGWVQGNLTECARSVFIFDEMETMPSGLIDVLEPFLGPAHVVFGTNYRKAIYIFIRRFLPVQRHPEEAHHLLRSVPAAGQTPRRALCPIAALSAGQLWQRRRGAGSRWRHELHPCPWRVFLHHWL